MRCRVRALTALAAVLIVGGIGLADLGPGTHEQVATAAPDVARPAARPMTTATAPTTTSPPPPPTILPPATVATVVPTTVAPVATTTAPPPTTPPPTPPTTAAPRPPQPSSLPSAFTSAVPAAWRAVIGVTLETTPGTTSWAQPDGRIQVGTEIVAAGGSMLAVTLAHEFGHLIAFHYGSQAFNGAAPAGWPAYGSSPEEAWADCVSRAFTGVDDPSHDLPSCVGTSLTWTIGWLALGPAAHPRTW